MPIRPRSALAETARLTRTPGFESEAVHYIKYGYRDLEDRGSLLITFDDGTVAQIAAADTTLGGIRNDLTVFASNAVATVNVNPNNLCVAYAPESPIFGNEYITEKIETTAGGTFPAPDEGWVPGYPNEIQDFLESIVNDREPLSGAALARDVVAVLFAGYQSASEGRRASIESSVSFRNARGERTMIGRVAVSHGPKVPFEIREDAVADPGPDEIPVKITLASVCGSDLHIWRGETPPFQKAPGVPGHEMTGVVAALAATARPTPSVGRSRRVTASPSPTSSPAARAGPV